MNHEARAVLGIDIGGTKIAAAIVTADGQLIARKQIATLAAEGPDAVITRLVSLAAELADVTPGGISGIGVGCPGPLDARSGLIQAPPNLPGWIDVPLVATLEAALRTSVFLDNDANLAALAEHRFGAGRGTKNLVYLTISTGIGGGIIIDGALYAGSNGNAGELGHVSVDYAGRECACGNRGCLEALASGTAVAARVREAIARGAQSSLGSAPEVTGAEVVEAVRRGDPLAREIWDDAMLALGTGIAGVINAFNPERVVLGGGLTHAGAWLFDPVRKIALSRAMAPIAKIVEIVPAELGADVGVLGAAALAFDRRRIARSAA